MPNPKLNLDDQRTVVIDDALINKWHPRYLEEDEGIYEAMSRHGGPGNELVGGSALKRQQSPRWNWKGAMRVIRHVQDRGNTTLFHAPAFRRAASEPPERKLAALPRTRYETAGNRSRNWLTIIHFIHPQVCQSSMCELSASDQGWVDLDSAEQILRMTRNLDTPLKVITHICPNWSLRKIDRALFAFHKQVCIKIQPVDVRFLVSGPRTTARSSPSHPSPHHAQGNFASWVNMGQLIFPAPASA